MPSERRRDPREATPDTEDADAFTVSVLGAAQTFANVNSDIDVKEYVRHISADPRQAVALIVSLLNLCMTDASDIIIQKLL